MRSFGSLLALVLLLVTTGCSSPDDADSGESIAPDAPDAAPLLVAHRGASAYAPEHTREAYELGIAQGADFIEPDLQITRDGVLIALHDVTLDRTTDVAEVFPDRYREVQRGDETLRRWFAVDFTLDEIRRLDAGSWFGPEFAGARIPTLTEVIEIARGRAGIFPETKAPETYAEQGFSMERLLVEELARHGLERRGADPATPVIVQSFSAESLRILREVWDSDLPATFLIGGSDGARWLTEEGLREVAGFATGIGPTKSLVLGRPEVVEAAHAAGLTVMPYTFRERSPGEFAGVAEEMAHFLCVLRVDGLFTDNPDLFPRGRCD